MDRQQVYKQLDRGHTRLILKRLAWEWRQLNATFLRGALSAPVFALMDNATLWGSWQPRGRLLSINEQLVREHPWQAVCEVLKHELAHQVVDEVFEVVGEAPHGPAFRRAAELLALTAKACPKVETGDPLRELRGDGSSNWQDGRLRKVRRLLALAESTNVHEAEAALLKAQELLLRYNIDLGEQTGEQGYGVRWLGAVARRRSRAVRLVSGILAQHFFVEAIWVDSFDVERGVAGRVLEISGRVENVELAEHVFYEVQRAADELWHKHRREAGLAGNKERRRFIGGVLIGFEEQLGEQAARRRADRALVWRGDPLLQAFVRARHPRVSSESLSVRGGGSFAAGREAGRGLRLRAGLREQARCRGRLIGKVG